MRTHDIRFQPAHQEYIVRSIIREQLINDNKSNLDLLTEGIAADLAQDAIQFAVGAAAEYGIGGAIAVGTMGAGAGVGPAVETAVDAAFAAKEVASTIEAVAAAAKNAGEFAGMLKDAINGFGGDFGGYYDKLKEAVQITVEKMSKDGKAKVEEIVEKLKEVVNDIVSEIVGAIEAGIKLVIPDATAGLAAAKAIGAAIKSLSENAYDALTSAIESVDLLNEAITNPDEVVTYFEEILQAIADKLIEVGEYFNDMSWPKALIHGGPVGGAILKKLGPKGFDELAGMLEKSIPDIVNVIEMVLKKVIPALFACLGIYQILMKDEYKTDDMKEKEEKEDNTGAIDVKKEKPSLTDSSNPLIGKSHLHRIINEVIEDNRSLIEMQGQLITNSPVRQFSPHIFEAEYVQGVLGIQIPLNESYPYSKSLRDKIIQEQLMMEGFFSSFKELAGGVKTMALTVRYIMEDPSRIKDFTNSVLATAKEEFTKFINWVKTMIAFAKATVKKWPMAQKLADFLEKLRSIIKGLWEAVASMDGWKKVLLGIAAAVGVKKIWSKITDSGGEELAQPDALKKMQQIAKDMGASADKAMAKLKGEAFVHSLGLTNALYESDEILNEFLGKLKDKVKKGFKKGEEKEKEADDKIQGKTDDWIKQLPDNVQGTATIARDSGVKMAKDTGKDFLKGMAKDAILGAVSGGVATFIKTLGKMVDGVKYVMGVIGDPMSKFVAKVKGDKEEAKEAEAGKDDPTAKDAGGTKKEEPKKESIRRRGNTLVLTRKQFEKIVTESLRGRVSQL